MRIGTDAEAFLPRAVKASYSIGMNAIVTHAVNEISDVARRTLEDLLGRHLDDNQKVRLVVISPPEEKDEETRREAIETIHRIQAKIDQHMADHGITSEQFDAAVDEAMEHIRPRPE